MWYVPSRQLPLSASSVLGDAAWRAGCAGPQWDEMEATMHGRVSLMAARITAAIVASIAVVGVTAATASASPAGGGHSTAASSARPLGKFAKPENWEYTITALKAGEWYGPVECKVSTSPTKRRVTRALKPRAAVTWRSARARARPANSNSSRRANMSRVAGVPRSKRLGLGRPRNGRPGNEGNRIHRCSQRQVVQAGCVLLATGD